MEVDQDGVKVYDVVLEGSVLEHDGLVPVLHHGELLLSEEHGLVVALPHPFQVPHRGGVRAAFGGEEIYEGECKEDNDRTKL